MLGLCLLVKRLLVRVFSAFQLLVKAFFKKALLGCCVGQQTTTNLVEVVIQPLIKLTAAAKGARMISFLKNYYFSCFKIWNNSEI